MPAYTGPVIDTHHHIWLRKDVPWLAEPPIPRMFGDYFGIRRDYPVRGMDRRRRAAGRHASRCTSPPMWGLGRALDETQLAADRLPTSTAFRTASSAMSISPISDVEAALKAQKQFPNVRGVRQMLYWDSRPCGRRRRGRITATTPEFRRGFALLEKYDLQLRIAGLCRAGGYAAELIKAFPTRAHDPGACRHARPQRTPQAIEQWRGALTTMAAFPDLHVKLSGLGMYSAGLTFAAWRCQVIRDSDPDLRHRAHASTAAISRSRSCTMSYADLSSMIYRKVSIGISPRPSSAQVLHEQCGEVGLA